MLSGPQTYKVKHYHTHTHIEKKPCAQEPCTHTHTNTKACSGVFWPRQALRPAWLFYHSFPQKCFSSSFSPWKTEFMTRHLFCWLHRPSAALVNDFPAILVASQNTWWHKWHEKYAIQFVSGYYFVGVDSHSYVLIMGIFCRLGCQAKQFLKAEEKRLYRLFWDLLNGPSCLFKFRLMAGSPFSEVSFCAARERRWETKCGKGVRRRR